MPASAADRTLSLLRRYARRPRRARRAPLRPASPSGEACVRSRPPRAQGPRASTALEPRPGGCEAAMHGLAAFIGTDGVAHDAPRVRGPAVADPVQHVAGPYRLFRRQVKSTPAARTPRDLQRLEPAARLLDLVLEAAVLDVAKHVVDLGRRCVHIPVHAAALKVTAGTDASDQWAHNPSPPATRCPKAPPAPQKAATRSTTQKLARPPIV